MSDNLAQSILPGGAASHTAFAASGGTALVAGFQGDSGDDNIQRVYLTPDCSTVYVEFPADAVVTSQELTSERSPFTGTAYWLPKNQDLTCWISAPLSADKLDATKLATDTPKVVLSPNGVQGTERFDPVSIAAGAWGVAGTLGLQDDIMNAAGSAADSVVSTVKGWFGW
jgi:hypothetical protein